MSNVIKKVGRIGYKMDPSARVADKQGISENNWARRVLKPLEKPMMAAAENGEEGWRKSILAGDSTDPLNAFHSSPAAEIPEPPKATTGEPEGQKARDRIRKRIYKAQGRQSTIRAGNAFGSFSGQQAQLLGS